MLSLSLLRPLRGLSTDLLFMPRAAWLLMLGSWNCWLAPSAFALCLGTPLIELFRSFIFVPGERTLPLWVLPVVLLSRRPKFKFDFVRPSKTRLWRLTSEARRDSNSCRFFELIWLFEWTKLPISFATFRSIYSCYMSLILPSRGYFRKKLRTRMSLMFDFLPKREPASESVFEILSMLRASGLRRLSA